MRTLFLLIAIASTIAGRSQTIPLISEFSDSYNKMLEKNRGVKNAEFLPRLTRENLLPIHHFNTSYLKGIGEFLEFKKTFHYAVGASDIPDEMSPLDYLLKVISRYESNGRYKVAILYYDAVDPLPVQPKISTEEDPLLQEDMAAFNRIKDSILASDSVMIDTTTIITDPDTAFISTIDTSTTMEDPAPIFDETGILDESKNLPDSLRQVKVWFLSSEHLSSVQSPMTYKDLGDLEALNRQQLAVSSLATERNVRSNRQPVISVDLSDTRNAAEELRKGLLPDAILNLMERDNINGVIIIPYGVIGQIPFQLLPVGDTTRFVDRYAFTVSPHLCNFNNVNRDNPGKTGTTNKLITFNPLIVGNPTFFSTDTLQLPELPGAAREADSIAKLLHAKPLTGAAAVYDTVVKKLKSSDFAYFATHAVPSFDDPVNKSFLALTPSRTSKTGFLTISQIQKNNLKNNKLVILSACQTGIGKAYKNGYCNIGRAFFIKGVDNSIISLWNLDDENIVAYMKILVEELQKPQNFYPAENLRQAALRYKRDVNPNPAYWSAMVNFGVCY